MQRLARAIGEQHRKILDAFRAALPETDDLTEGQAVCCRGSIVWSGVFFLERKNVPVIVPGRLVPGTR